MPSRMEDGTTFPTGVAGRTRLALRKQQEEKNAEGESAKTGRGRTMPPVKKGERKIMDPGTRKTKDSGKLKSAKSDGTMAVELRAPDWEWWCTFLDKQAKSGAGAPHSDQQEEAFRHFFRMSKSTFAYICSIVRKDLTSRPPPGLINIEGRLFSVEKQVAIAIWRLASGDSQMSVGAAFGVGQSTVSQVTWRFIESMERNARHHLVWPNRARMEEIKSNLDALSGLPNCCGAIDATHIVMTLPDAQSSQVWRDPAGKYSMILQGIFDDEMRFIDIITGYPGSLPFEKMLEFSRFYKLCQAGKRLDGPVRGSSCREDAAEIREFIVGDKCYPLLPWLMTPYEEKNLSPAMVNFNDHQNAARMVGIRALAKLKHCWRILDKVMWRPNKNTLPSMVLVCCLLHNIVIDCKDDFLSDGEIPDHHETGYNRVNCEEVDPDGEEMREILTGYLPTYEAI